MEYGIFDVDNALLGQTEMSGWMSQLVVSIRSRKVLDTSVLG